MPSKQAINKAALLLNKKVMEMIGEIMKKHSEGVLAGCAEDRLYMDHLLSVIKSHGIRESHESSGRVWYARKGVEL